MTINKHKGSNFDDFLAKEGLLDDVDAVAIKRVIAYELTKTMKKEKMSKTTLAANLKTSRSALDRLLDPNNTSITLNSLVKAAHLLGKKLQILFV
jgi:antitoxin HicB